MFKFKYKESYDCNGDIRYIIEKIKQESFAVVSNFYTADECKKLREEIDLLIEIREKRNNLWTDECNADKRCFAAEDDSQLIYKYNTSMIFAAI